MTLRCKPGDLCVIVKAAGEEPAVSILRAAIGRIVKVVRIVPARHERFRCYTDDNWELEDPVKINIASFPLETFYIEAVSDSMLCPIRDPGADAQDETLAWKPVPTTEEVTA